MPKKVIHDDSELHSEFDSSELQEIEAQETNMAIEAEQKLLEIEKA